MHHVVQFQDSEPWFFCQDAFILNVLRFHGNLRVLLTTDHQVSWAVTAQYFPHYTIQSLQHGLLAEKDPKTVKRIVEEEWQQMLYKLLCSSIHLQLASNLSNGRNYGARSLPCWVLIPVKIKVRTNQWPNIFSISSKKQDCVSTASY